MGDQVSLSREMVWEGFMYSRMPYTEGEGWGVETEKRSVVARRLEIGDRQNECELVD